MARAKWIKGVFAVLACAGFVCGQQVAPPSQEAANSDQVIIVQEPGGPQQQCKLLTSWLDAQVGPSREPARQMR